MNTMNTIAAVAQTRTINAVTGEAHYIDLPQRPVGAPGDYVKAGDLMKKFRPDLHQELTDAIRTGGDWSGILLSFAEQAAKHREWTDQYINERKLVEATLQNTKIPNRFHADTSDLNTFRNSIDNTIANEAVANKELLQKNMDYFVHVLRQL
jgi:hypothetical protein